ncbi:hypothetical protein LTR91_000890 [Friedmanniomyces endolithicus]|uniref:DUF1742-domain-containing protein n=1 Tax=Friedmanniomyces endolithicus TaxID=329885 RepID=A0AAN6L274_9PEZI|nr:hypothetical protein LTR94_009136 [Friedmanniomyces endolithicus]KAK0796969.1 hypothetical protein LTR38_008380 [Friedmanniomyces endolithicus]KAK0803208.1 hypothetical protein LTR59_004771 [Friedmanniomyces endolithicus]KAK0810750.1 hypothetical protein LTR75_005478 [Friedmanniomyces endolithicus]KAK0849650.1 hypothetical protein LTR03_005068 [Friedmanniomyces endolithicus]
MVTKNLYHRRLVADSAAKACWICYKPSSIVLITPDQDDYFYICAGHLKDTKFATAKDADDVAERKRNEELAKEIEAVKKEFEEKMRKKMARRKQKEYEKDGKEEKKKDGKEAEKEDAKDETEKEERLKELEKKKDPVEKAKEDGPRVFELHKQFWGMRVQKKRDAEVARRNRERLRTQGGLPSVPTGSEDDCKIGRLATRVRPNDRTSALRLHEKKTALGFLAESGSCFSRAVT